MESKALSIDTGLVTYSLNGKVELTFNPTDTVFVERLYSVFEELDKKQEEYKAEIKNHTTREIFDIARQRNEEMREMIDGALDAPVCDAVFGDMNVYAMANGLPAWANLLLAIIDEVDSGVTSEQKKTDARIRKYSEKYKRR